MLKAIMILIVTLLSGNSFSQDLGVASKKLNRIALVVGNSEYDDKQWRRLKSPGKDARDFADILISAGFESKDIQLSINEDGKTLKGRVEDFGVKLRQLKRRIELEGKEAKEAIVAVVFYSGHGFAIQEAAYLVGIDATGKYVEEVASQSVNLSRLIQDITFEEQDVDVLSIVLMDACRTDLKLPSRAGQYAKNIGAGDKSGPFGSISGIGRISVMATRPGKISLDGRTPEENSVFTEAIKVASIKPQSPKTFGEFIKRIQTRTPEISKAKYNLSQHPEIQYTGVTIDFPWSPTQQAAIESSAQALNSQKGSVRSSDEKQGWIWIGDYKAGETRDWSIARFYSSSTKEKPRPSEIAKGTNLTITANLNVRARFPQKTADCSGKYMDCAPLLGTLPRGLEVRVVDGPRGYAHQQWVKVAYDPRAIY